MNCSNFNENLFLTGDNEEINLWDIRNYTKSLFTVKYSGANQVEFGKTTSNHIIISKDNVVEYICLSDLKTTDNNDSNGVKVGLLVCLWWTFVSQDQL